MWLWRIIHGLAQRPISTQHPLAALHSAFLSQRLSCTNITNYSITLSSASSTTIPCASSVVIPMSNDRLARLNPRVGEILKGWLAIGKSRQKRQAITRSHLFNRKAQQEWLESYYSRLLHQRPSRATQQPSVPARGAFRKPQAHNRPPLCLLPRPQHSSHIQHAPDPPLHRTSCPPRSRIRQ